MSLQVALLFFFFFFSNGFERHGFGTIGHCCYDHESDFKWEYPMKVCRSVAATISRPPRLVGRKDYARTIGPGLALPFLIIFSFLTVSARWDRDFIAMKDLFKFVIREMKGTWNDLPFFFSHWIVEIFTLIWRIPRKLETRLNNAVYCTENLTTRISH